MKLTSYVLQFICVLLMINVASGQGVKDIPQTFKDRGFVQNIDYAEKIMYVNLIIKEKEISLEEIKVSTAEITNDDKVKLNFSNIKSNDEIIIEGERYTESGYCEAKKITLITKRANEISNGRIDSIGGDIAYVDGNKVKLQPGKLIKGKKNSPYEGKIFATVNDIKLGDIAHCEGAYKEPGFFYASEFSISPNNITENDRKADTVDADDYKRFHKQWLDKRRRKDLFNAEVAGIGKIYDNPEVQDYIQTFATKLVPPHVRAKIDFIFIVVENEALNANVRSNGLAYIYTGLLKNLDNEAQLATILSHEIAHAIYEHNAKSGKDQEDAAGKKDVTNKTSKIGEKGRELWGKIKNGDKRGRNHDDKNDDKGIINAETTSVVSDAMIDKRLSVYSIKDEYQADRVGLSLMTLAGYDPREAAIVWKEIYERYGVLPDTTMGRQVLGDVANEINAPDTTKSDKNQKKNQIITLLRQSW